MLEIQAWAGGRATKTIVSGTFSKNKRWASLHTLTSRSGHADIAAVAKTLEAKTLE